MAPQPCEALLGRKAATATLRPARASCPQSGQQQQPAVRQHADACRVSPWLGRADVCPQCVYVHTSASSKP